ncbi:pyridoxal phosphate-dependent decarboxylase family protein [Paludibaculum fermentans]|uniref:Aspartate aminotransferase family protein n=1 Tax=Paludibaculum fermentans TaxID=1473598 RepID=A0A7S7SJQ7_PALFE|nr:aminotransferase class I/II-fold pyridoxal phosphate-dependent enzyme [Paludibaculum fermentans]QOY86691.1 aspartate aminotransferase family protein [Paludibaculum fermentans]
MAMERFAPSALNTALEDLDRSFAHLPEFTAEVQGQDRMLGVLRETAARLGDNFPYFHPLYAGQMLKPPHPLARAAYALATWINPNNHALDGGRASSAMEKEAVAELAAMFGWNQHLGHLSSGGTMANLEALWVAGQLQPGQAIAASSQAHYTHERISGVLHLPFAKVDADDHGRLNCQALERRLEQGGIGCVVATLGTTGVGAVDPLPEILKLRERYGFRLHVDSAYGGYFRLAGNLAPATRAAYDLIGEADSIVIDPHKHGLQPYGCGCVLFRDPAVGRLYKHESPYTYFSSHELHLGEISLECSRPGASAVALWATQRLLPTVPGGEFAQGLEASRRAALTFAARLKDDPRFVVPFDPELDIIVWAPRAPSASESSGLSQRIFDLAAEQQLHLALIHLPVSIFRAAWPDLQADQPTIVCLRSVLMKPEHESWLDRIYAILGSTTDAARST